MEIGATALAIQNVAEAERGVPKLSAVSDAQRGMDELNSSAQLLKELEALMRETRWLQVAVGGTTGSSASFPLTEEFVNRVKLFNDTTSQACSWQNLIIRHHGKTGPVTLAHHPAFADATTTGSTATSADDHAVAARKIAFAVSSLLEIALEDGVRAVYDATMEAARAFLHPGADEPALRAVHSCPLFGLLCRTAFEADMEGTLRIGDRVPGIVGHWYARMKATGILAGTMDDDLHSDLQAQLRATAHEAAYLSAWCEVANSPFMPCVPSPDSATDGAAFGTGAAAATAAVTADVAPLATRFDRARHRELEYGLPHSKAMKQGKMEALPLGLVLRPRLLAAAAAGGDTAMTGGAGTSGSAGAAATSPVAGPRPACRFPPNADAAVALRPLRITARGDAGHSYQTDMKVWVIPGQGKLVA